MEVKRLPGQFGEAGLEHIITLLPQFKNSLPDLLEQERLIVVYMLRVCTKWFYFNAGL